MKNFLNILSVFVLMGGVIAGAVLVQNEQDIRNSAAPDDKVSICHKTGNGEEFNKIEIAEQAVQSHLDHGDTLSGCDTPSQADASPSQQPEQPNTVAESVVETAQPVSTQTPVETEQPVVATATVTSLPTEAPVENTTSTEQQTTQTSNDTNTSSSNQQNNTSNSSTSTSDTPPVTVNTNTFISPINKNVFNFKFKLQNVTRSGVSKNVTLTFYKSGKQMVRNVQATSSANGVFTGSISGLDQGIYEVVIKVDSYLSQRFKNVNISTTDSSWDWTTSGFKGVDFNHDNVLNIVDVGMILAVYNQKSVSVTPSNSQYDVNSDNVINEDDIEIVLSYYTSLTVRGEF